MKIVTFSLPESRCIPWRYFGSKPWYLPRWLWNWRISRFIKEHSNHLRLNGRAGVQMEKAVLRAIKLYR